MKSSEDLLDEMFKSNTAEDENENEPPKKKIKREINDHFDSKSYLDILSSKVMLVFSLFAHHLRQ